MAPQLSAPEAAMARAMKALGATTSEICDALYKQRKKWAKNRGRRPKAVKPHPSTVYRLLEGITNNPEKKKKKKETRGRPRKTTPKEDKNMLAVHARLESKIKHANVTSRMVNTKWDTEEPVADRSVRRRFQKEDMPYLYTRKKKRLTKEQKQKRAAFGIRLIRKGKKFWTRDVLCIDEKRFAYFTSKKARATARSMRKTRMYRKRGMGLAYSVPSTKKHRQGCLSVCVCVGLGQGKVQFSEAFHANKGNMNTDTYVHFVHEHILPSMRRMEKPSNDRKVYLQRDNAPQRGTKRGGAGRLSQNRGRVKLPEVEF